MQVCVRGRGETSRHPRFTQELAVHACAGSVILLTRNGATQVSITRELVLPVGPHEELSLSHKRHTVLAPEAVLSLS